MLRRVCRLVKLREEKEREGKGRLEKGVGCEGEKLRVQGAGRGE